MNSNNGQELHLTGEIQLLPVEILLIIFGLLNFSDLSSVKRVCKSWRAIQYRSNLYLGAKLKIKDVKTKAQLKKYEKICEYFYNFEIQNSNLQVFATFFNKAIRNPIYTIKFKDITFHSDMLLLDVILATKADVRELKFECCNFVVSGTPTFSKLLTKLETIEILRPIVQPNCRPEIKFMRNLPENQIINLTLTDVNSYNNTMALGVLQMIRQNSESLKKFHFYENENSDYGVTDEFWKELNDCHMNLESFATSFFGNSFQLKQFLRTQTNLRYLKLDNVAAIDDGDVWFIAKQSQHLKTIEIKSCKNITNFGVFHLTHLTALKHLTVHPSCEPFRTREGIIIESITHGLVARTNLNITKIDIKNIYFPMAQLIVLTQNLPNLEILRVVDLYERYNRLTYVPACNLRSYNQKLLKVFENCANVKELTWKNLRNIRYEITDSANLQHCRRIDHKNTLKNLERLEISDFNVFVKMFNYFDLPKMKSLQIVEVAQLERDYIPIFAARPKMVQYLETNNLNVDQMDLLFELFPELKTLNFLRNCSHCLDTKYLVVKHKQPAGITRTKKRRCFRKFYGNCWECRRLFSKLQDDFDTFEILRFD